MSTAKEYIDHAAALRLKWHGDGTMAGDLNAVTLSEAKLLCYARFLMDAVEAASVYINCSDRELQDLGITREDALRKFHEAHSTAVPPS